MVKLYQTDAGVRQQLVVIGFCMSACYLLLYATDCVNEFFCETHVDHLPCSHCCWLTNQDTAFYS